MCCTRSPACERVLKQRFPSGLGEHGRYPVFHCRTMESYDDQLRSILDLVIGLENDSFGYVELELESAEKPDLIDGCNVLLHAMLDQAIG